MKAILIVTNQDSKFLNLHGQTFDVVEVTQYQVCLMGLNKSEQGMIVRVSHKDVLIVDIDKEYRYWESVMKDENLSDIRRNLADYQVKALQAYCVSNGIEFSI